MLDEQILDCCKRMRLSRNLAEMAQSTEGETHQEYLYHLLCEEIRYREHCRTGKLIHDAGFYTVKTFDGFHFEEVTLPGDLTVEQLKTLDFIKEKQNVVLYGNQGTGKTFLSTALGVAACQVGLSVRFFRTAALLDRLLHHCHLLLFPGSSHRMRESSIHELYHCISPKS